MRDPFLLFAILLLVSALLTGIASFIARHHSLPGSFALSLLLLSMTGWSAFYAIGWLPFPLQLRQLAANFIYIGVVAVPMLFLVFVLAFIHRGQWENKRLLFLLVIEPALTLVLVWTNHAHGFVFESSVIQSDNFSWVKLIPGPWYKFNLVYSYLIILSGFVILLYGMWQSRSLLNNQNQIILVAASLPWAINIYCEAVLGRGIFDFTPLAFGLSGILFTYSTVRNGFMDIIPVARSQIVESMSDGILVIDTENRIVDINPAMEKFLGQETASFVGKHISEALQDWTGQNEPLLTGQETRTELRLPDAPSRYLDLRITPVYDRNQRLKGRVMVFRDVTDRKHVEKKLRSANDRLQSQLIEIGTLQSKLRAQAIRDPLTELFNRRYLDETFERELARASRESYPVCVLMLDIDHFKKLNDTYGHEAGDLVLKALAKTLSTRNRRGDFVCRYGGEEFVVVMPNIEVATAHKRAEDLRQALNALHVPYGRFNLTITISIGIASYPANGKSRETVLRSADRAMYAAKDAGRDHILAYDDLQSRHHRSIN
jgi:diguanylate cyclase (GGDEF)-like protein/PAS domain S-box-containing protein